ncbi:EXS family-domain-containing protein [Chaetomium strumarium]|uniref:EXS family-domain-containing protein n=1 Tax=Chaetomium strumarium TaxID=1170767 RepID=A0AAJ0GZ26_9PEZI|nr:EXS family-domain-containing protein [Chaetomium strumarium]
MTILTAVWLSLYRIGDTQTNLSLYIALATINAVYCSIWDLFMDFSVLQGNARHRLLRDITALRPVWIYYLIMVIDPILRFSWIFYAIFTHDAQHSTIVSFMVSLAEVVRRGLWTLLRVENEHCANVAQYKASRDTPLPYHLENFVQRPSLEEAAATTTASLHHTPSAMDGGPAPPTTPKTPRTVPPQTPGTASSQRHGPVPTPLSEAAVEVSAPAMPTTTTTGAATTALEGGAGGPGTFRRRRTDTLGKRSILQAMAEAHKQDFEKRRVPAGEERKDSPLGGDEEEDDDEEEEEEELKSEEERIEEEEDEEADTSNDSREGPRRGGLRRMGTRGAREGSGDRGLMPGGGSGGHKGPDDTYQKSWE